MQRIHKSSKSFSIANTIKDCVRAGTVPNIGTDIHVPVNEDIESRLEILEALLGDHGDHTELEIRITELEDIIGSQLPNIVQQLAEILIALQQLNQGQGDLGDIINNLENNQNGQGIDLSAIIQQLAVVANTILSHDNLHNQHTTTLGDHNNLHQQHTTTLTTHQGKLTDHDSKHVIELGVLAETFGAL